MSNFGGKYLFSIKTSRGYYLSEKNIITPKKWWLVGKSKIYWRFLAWEKKIFLLRNRDYFPILPWNKVGYFSRNAVVDKLFLHQKVWWENHFLSTTFAFFSYEQNWSVKSKGPLLRPWSMGGKKWIYKHNLLYFPTIHCSQSWGEKFVVTISYGEKKYLFIPTTYRFIFTTKQYGGYQDFTPSLFLPLSLH